MGKARRHTVRKLTPEKVTEQLSAIVSEMLEVENKFSPQLGQLHENFKLSGANLVHYMVMRSSEIRAIQDYCHELGLSSLAHSESHTMYEILKVLGWLNKASDKVYPPACDVENAISLSQMHAEQLLGPFHVKDRPHIMVTFSSKSMQRRKLVEDMLNEGMTVARINCAHDTPEVWLKMIKVLKKAMVKTGKSCKLYMDLGGPKIRIRQIHSRKKSNREALPVVEGQELMLCACPENGKKIKRKWRKKYDIVCIEPGEILGMIREGEHIYFDDGQFEAKIVSCKKYHAIMMVVRISANKPLLKPEKGINLPDSELSVRALTDEDKSNLPFICEHADMVGYSFVHVPDEIEALREEMNKQVKGSKPAIVLKIERVSAVQNLPALMLNGMKDEAFGVMIARGDLAVQIGFERLSEIQQEILWICEAAHVPVIWATQVLESLNKTGYATRSEITDAAMGVRAECVMLNKGKYILKTIKTLEDILLRQVGHIHKKQYIMRPLGIASAFVEGAESSPVILE